MGFSVTREAEAVLFGLLSVTKQYSVRNWPDLPSTGGFDNADLEKVGHELSKLRVEVHFLFVRQCAAHKPGRPSRGQQPDESPCIQLS